MPARTNRGFLGEEIHEFDDYFFLCRECEIEFETYDELLDHNQKEHTVSIE